MEKKTKKDKMRIMEENLEQDSMEILASWQIDGDRQILNKYSEARTESQRFDDSFITDGRY